MTVVFFVEGGYGFVEKTKVKKKKTVIFLLFRLARTIFVPSYMKESL